VHGGWDLQGVERVGETVGAPLPDQHPGLHQGVHTFLQKKGIALGAGDQEPGESPQPGIVPQERLEQAVRARLGQGVEPELGIVRFTAPAVLILRAVVNQQQHPGGRQALHQHIEDGLRLAVDPVQVFKDQEQRLHLAFTQEETLQRLQRATSSLQGVQGLERTVGGQGFE
jgi:hypothetical protein